MSKIKDTESRAPAQAAHGVAVHAALVALLLTFQKGMLQPEATGGNPTQIAGRMVAQFLKEYPAIGAAFSLRDAGMRVMLHSANVLDGTVLSSDMVTVLNEALEAAGAWDDLLENVRGGEDFDGDIAEGEEHG